MAKKNVVLRIKEYLDKCPPARKLFDELSEAGKCYFIGGVLREYKDHEMIQNIRDLDIIFQAYNADTLPEICKRYGATKNNFDGYKMICSDLVVDVWEMENTWAFREKKVSYEKNKMPQALQETVFLNMDAIIYDVEQDIWYEEKYDKAMSEHVLDIVLEDNPHLNLNLLRAMIIRKKYDMSYSYKLKQLIWDNYTIHRQLFIDELLQLQQHRYRKEVLSREDINIECMLCEK